MPVAAAEPEPMSPAAHARLLAAFADRLHAFQARGRHFEVLTTIGSAADLGTPEPPADLAPARPPPPPPPPASAGGGGARRGALIVLDSSFNPPTRAHLRMATSAARDLRRRGGAAAGPLRLLLLLAVNNADKAPKPAAFEHRLAMMRELAGDVQDALLREGAAAGALPVDIGLTAHPYFHEKSAAVASSGFYSGGAATAAEGGTGGGTGARPGAEDAGPEQVFLAGYDTLIRIFDPKYYAPPVPAAAGAPPAAAAGKTPMQSALDPFLARARLRVTVRADAEWGGGDEQEAYVRALAEGGPLERAGGRRAWAARIELAGAVREAGEGAVSSTLARRAAREGRWEALEGMVGRRVGAWVRGEGLYAED